MKERFSDSGILCRMDGLLLKLVVDKQEKVKGTRRSGRETEHFPLWGNLLWLPPVGMSFPQTYSYPVVSSSDFGSIMNTIGQTPTLGVIFDISISFTYHIQSVIKDCWLFFQT